MVINETIDRSSKDLLQFAFNLHSIYLQFTFKSIIFELLLYECLPSIYLQLTFILHWLTFNLPSHFWSKYFYIQLTFNLHSTYL